MELKTPNQLLYFSGISDRAAAAIQMRRSISRRVRDLSIRRKLILITMSTCGIAVMLAIGIFIGLDLPSYRHGLELDLTSTAAMAGANSKAALAFGDEEAAAETLSALSAKPLVIADVEAARVGVEEPV